VSRPLSRLVEDQPQWAYPETDGLAPDCADRRCDDCRAGDCCCTCHLPDARDPGDDPEGWAYE
jgi:hypothetical protein